MTTFLNLLQAVICLGVAYNCLDRSGRTCLNTFTSIRLSFVGMGVASVALALWPWWAHVHDLLDLTAPQDVQPMMLVFELSVLAVQTYTRTHWRNARGVPKQYLIDPEQGCEPHARRSTDGVSRLTE